VFSYLLQGIRRAGLVSRDCQIAINQSTSGDNKDGTNSLHAIPSRTVEPYNQDSDLQTWIPGAGNSVFWYVSVAKNQSLVALAI